MRSGGGFVGGANLESEAVQPSRFLGHLVGEAAAPKSTRSRKGA